MGRNPHFTALLKRMAEVHESKSHDYAEDDNVFSNFEFAALVAKPFTDPIDRVFATVIGIKLARLAELRKGKVPKNEAIEDTGLDASNYMAIWTSKLMRDLELNELVEAAKKQRPGQIIALERPTYNHTREDSPLYPCSICWELMTEEEKDKVIDRVRPTKEKAEVETPASKTNFVDDSNTL